MIPAAFEYAKASSVEEAVKHLDDYGEDAKVLAGGHSLIPLMRLRLAQPKALVDINGIKGLDHIEVKGSKVHIGALTRHVAIQNSSTIKEKLPILAEVAGEVGDNQVRNMGTIGGVIAHADAAGDYPTLALMLDADIVTNKRTIHAHDFFKDIFTTSLAPNEIVTEVVFDVADGPHKYIKFRRRLFDWAIVGAAAQKVDRPDARPGQGGRGRAGQGRQAGRGRPARVRRAEPVRRPARQPGVQEAPREGAGQKGDRTSPIDM